MKAVVLKSPQGCVHKVFLASGLTPKEQAKIEDRAWEFNQVVDYVEVSEQPYTADEILREIGRSSSLW
jgi:hypothetical protein